MRYLLLILFVIIGCSEPKVKFNGDFESFNTSDKEMFLDSLITGKYEISSIVDMKISDALKRRVPTHGDLEYQSGGTYIEARFWPFLSAAEIVSADEGLLRSKGKVRTKDRFGPTGTRYYGIVFEVRGSRFKVNSIAVSYTHLTLPTIYSV